MIQLLMISFHSGKSESITIKNERGRLSEEEIERMVREAEEFASEDESQRKRIEAINSLSTFIYGVKNQIADQEGLGGKISDEDRKTLLSLVKETTDWVDSEAPEASLEDLEDKLAEVQAVVNPITSKLYSSGPSDDDEDDPIFSHDEL